MPKSNIDISRIKMATDIPTDKRKQYISVRKQPFEFDWQQRIKVLTRAMVLAGDKLVISGPPDVISEEPLEPQQYDLKRILNKFEEQNDVFAGRHHGILAIVSAKDGKILSEQKLQSPPVFNGMIIANGKVFIADMKGCIVCYR
jgi:hypothetical protein